MPKRIQLSRKKGWRLPANTVVVSRPSKWGNPHRLQKYGKRESPELMMMDAMHGVSITPEATVNHFRRDLKTPEGRILCRAAKKELRGKNLACWCKPGAPCHADVWLEVANK